MDDGEWNPRRVTIAFRVLGAFAAFSVVMAIYTASTRPAPATYVTHVRSK